MPNIKLLTNSSEKVILKFIKNFPEREDEILNFATNNIFYAQHDADYDRVDKKNFKKNTISTNLLNYIENDQNGLSLALFF